MIPGLGVAMVLLPIFIFDRQTPFPSIYTLVPTLGTAILNPMRYCSEWSRQFQPSSRNPSDNP